MTSQSTGDTSKVPNAKPHVLTSFFPVIPPQRPGVVLVVPDMEQVTEAPVTKTANLWTYPINTLYKHALDPHRREKPSISALAIGKQTNTHHLPPEHTLGEPTN